MDDFEAFMADYLGNEDDYRGVRAPKFEGSWQYLGSASDGWKAINFNQAHHSLRRGGYSQVDKLRRDFQHSVYKFGQCDRENLLRKYLRKTLVTKIPTEAEAPQRFLYLLAKKNTINRKLQCVVVKIFTNRLFMFVNSRFPMYYCQGIVHYLMMNSIQRLEVHEFFLSGEFKLPADINFNFYHPNPDY
ncbi:uncharacterized protein LOC113229974 [Hyposmocoma kahamanoa]|uniref:uncharacterized protein LOC113229974 n=1 Tax=Hyposmocoma kahamanoa TaxID=1477025 RepID=UPI000E6D629E|nr:uncharacterized protein LOC113229974 [Hyposmocoma kahamanoa]